MPQKLFNVNFGKLRADAIGAQGVGYQIFNDAGTVVTARTTAGVYQIAPGIYSALVEFPAGFSGQILWDTGDHFFDEASYAAEEYRDVDSSNDLIQKIYDIQFGRWKIENNQMIFYKEDNSTEVVRFDLFDESGKPSVEVVFERLRV
jgi:hypothetical protein